MSASIRVQIHFDPSDKVAHFRGRKVLRLCSLLDPRTPFAVAKLDDLNGPWYIIARDAKDDYRPIFDDPMSSMSLVECVRYIATIARLGGGTAP